MNYLCMKLVFHVSNKQEVKLISECKWGVKGFNGMDS